MSVTELETRVEGRENPSQAELSASGSFAESLVGLIDRLGRYVLLDRLGRGAFGTVWAAYDPQLDRRVAIKIVHAAGRRDEALSEAHDDLLSEAQLLAQLSHPNVVAIYDVGRLEDALMASAAADTTQDETNAPTRGVFIVMEQLDGPTLAQWLEAEQTRDPAEILRVFEQAGRGLEAAHAHDFVHLDFKPGNVMFGAGRRIRVLDFGLARVGRRPRRRDVERSRVVGTPAYMAPEQHEGRTADPRTDQFAFCVALWEALYGARPFAGDDVKTLYAAKRAGPPPAPPGAIPHVHAAIARGLSVERDARFESMGALLAVLADNPQLRRRRWVAGVTLVAGLIGAGFGLAQASDDRADPCLLPADQFADIWDAERRERVAAAFAATGVAYADETFDQVAGDLDNNIAHWSAVRREVCQASLVDAEVSVEQMSEQLLCLDRQLRSIAGLSEALTEADAEVVARARDSVLALEPADACRLDADSDDAVLGRTRRLALLRVEDRLARARIESELGHYEDGLAAADQAVALAGELDDPNGLARGQRERGVLLRELGRLDEAKAASMDALARAAATDQRALESLVLDDLMSVHAALGEFETALAVRGILGARVDPTRDPALATKVHVHASVVHERQQHWDEALAELDAALLLVGDQLGDPAELRAQIHHNYGNVLIGSARDYARSASEYERAIELWTAAYGPHHPALAKARMNLATVHHRLGDPARAIELLRAAFTELERIYEPDHPYISFCHQNLGALHMGVGEFHEAIRHTRSSLEIAASTLGPEHPNYATIERNLATMLRLLGEYREAREHLEHAAAIYVGAYDSHDPRRMALAAELAELAWWFGDHERARAHAAEAEAMLAEAEPGELRRVSPLSTLALLAAHDGELERAHAYAVELVRTAEAALDSGDTDLARARVQLAEILRRLGQLDEARAQLELAEAAFERPQGLHPHAWVALLERGRLALAEGQRARAREHFEAALELTRGPEGSDVHAAIVELELAAISGGEQARTLREQARATLAARGVRPDLQ